MAETLVFDLTEPQSAIALSNKKKKIVVAGRRFGKSFLAYEEMFKRAVSLEATLKGGYNIWYVANTADNARRIMWKSYLTKEQYVPSAYIAKKNEQRMEMVFKNGSSISVFSGEEPDSLRGSSIDFLVMDECAFLKRKAYDTVYPATTDKYCKGEILLISSPDGYNWFYDIYAQALEDMKDPDSDWEAFHYTTIEGGNVLPEEVEKAKKTMTLKEFRKEYEASFETMSDKVYENYDKDFCDCPEDKIDPTWGLGDIHIGMDFNVHPMTAAISVIEEDRELGEVATFFDEIITEGFANTQAMCDKIKMKYPRATVFVYPDPTCRKHQTNAEIGVTDKTILEDNGFIVCVPRGPYSSKDKWNTVNTGLHNADDECHVRIARSRCPKLVKALDGYCFKENGEPDKSGGLDHISDAFAYEVCYKFPIKARGKLSRPPVYGF